MKKVKLNTKKVYQKYSITEDTLLTMYLVLDNEQRSEFFIEINHQIPMLKSDTIIKAVLFDKSHLSVKCDLIVGIDAKRVDCNLSLQVLLISDLASAKLDPNLEIATNDIKASHSAYIKTIDDQEMFYLRSKGLTKNNSEKLIIDAFLYHE